VIHVDAAQRGSAGCKTAKEITVTVTDYGNGTLEEYLPAATTFGAPASSTAGHVGWREVARNRDE
jgi:hypothetical protein